MAAARGTRLALGLRRLRGGRGRGGGGPGGAGGLGGPAPWRLGAPRVSHGARIEIHGIPKPSETHKNTATLPNLPPVGFSWGVFFGGVGGVFVCFGTSKGVGTGGFVIYAWPGP